MKTEEILSEREKTHGDFVAASETHYKVKALFRPPMEKNGVPLYRIEAVEAIIAKLNRIVHGNHDHADHWDDIAGYAMLGKGQEWHKMKKQSCWRCGDSFLRKKINDGETLCMDCVDCHIRKKMPHCEHNNPEIWVAFNKGDDPESGIARHFAQCKCGYVQELKIAE